MEVLRKAKKCAEKSGGCECRYCPMHVPCQKMKEACDKAISVLTEGDDGK